MHLSGQVRITWDWAQPCEVHSWRTTPCKRFQCIDATDYDLPNAKDAKAQVAKVSLQFWFRRAWKLRVVQVQDFRLLSLDTNLFANVHTKRLWTWATPVIQWYLNVLWCCSVYFCWNPEKSVWQVAAAAGSTTSGPAVKRKSSIEFQSWGERNSSCPSHMKQSWANLEEVTNSKQVSLWRLTSADP